MLRTIAFVALSKDYFVLSVIQTCSCHTCGIFQRYFNDGNSIRAAAPCHFGIERNRSDRRPSTSVYRKFIRSHRHVTAGRFEEDRQPLAIVVADARKWKLLDIASIMVRRTRQMARGGKRPRKVAESRRKNKRFFIGQWDARKNVIALVGRIHAVPQFLAAIRHTVASRTSRIKKTSETRYDFSFAVYSISKTFFHITALLVPDTSVSIYSWHFVVLEIGIWRSVRTKLSELTASSLTHYSYLWHEHDKYEKKKSDKYGKTTRFASELTNLCDMYF